jgi:hypothetical protein
MHWNVERDDEDATTEAPSSIAFDFNRCSFRRTNARKQNPDSTDVLV